jgi:HTH-type transcriptional regulator/antitoxin HipB
MEYLLQLPEQLALHLKSLRKAAGVSQVQLAQRLGLSQSRIAAIERDPSAISVRQLLEILQLLDADVLLRPRSAAAGQPRRPDTYAAPASSEPPIARVAEGDVGRHGAAVPGLAEGEGAAAPSADARTLAFRPQTLPSQWQTDKPKGHW